MPSTVDKAEQLLDANRTVALAEPKWREEIPVERPRNGRSNDGRRVRRGLLLAIVLLLGASAGLSSWIAPAPRPYFVPLWITECRPRPVPNNPPAAHDRQALAASGLLPNVSTSAVASQSRHLMELELAALARRSGDDTLVVYLSAYAGVDEHGKVFVLPGDVQLEDARSRLPLATIVDYVRRCPAKGKLLVLDIMWPVADVRLGIAANDVASQIPAEIGGQSNELLVLCASSSGQTSLASDELSRGAFGYYFERGLRGAADGWNSQGVQDGRVSAREAAAYVASRVDRWAEQNRGERQTPVLLGGGPDFDLSSAAMTQSDWLMQLPAVEKYPPWLLAAWQLHDAWAADDTFRHAPRLFQQLEAAVLRADLQWQQGGDPARLQSDLQTQLAPLVKQRETVKQLLTPPAPRSLGLATAAGQIPDPAVATAIAEFLDKLNGQTQVLTSEQVPAAQAKLYDELKAKLKDKSSFDVASAAFSLAAADPLARPERLRSLASLLKLEQPRPMFVETLLLSQLADLNQRLPRTAWPADTVNRTLQNAAVGERAAGSAVALPWVRALLDRAASQRHNAERALLLPGFAPPEEPARLAREAADSYARVLAQIDIVEQAWRTADDADRLLPALAPCLPERADLQAPWFAAAAASADLSAELEVVSNKEPSASELSSALNRAGERRAAVQAALDALLQPFTSDCVARLMAQSRRQDAPAALVDEMRTLLSLPVLAAVDRSALWQARRDLSRRLCERTLEADAAADRLASASPSKRAEIPAAFDATRAEREQAKRASIRLQVAVAQLHMAGFQTEQFAGASQAELPEALLTAISTDLPKQLTSAADVAARARLALAAPAFDACTMLDDVRTNPNVQLAASLLAGQSCWLAERYRYEAHDGDAWDFYAEAAAQLCQASSPPADGYVEFSGSRTLESLTRDNPQATCDISWKLVAPANEASEVTVDAVSPCPEALKIVVPFGPAPAGVPLSLAVQFLPQNLPAPSTSPDSAAPLGILARFTWQGKSFHWPVNVPALSKADLWHVVASPNPLEPSPAVDVLRVRPAGVPQPFYLYVTNASAKATEVIVELANPQAVKKLGVPAGGWAKIAFDGPEPKPGAPLPELQGPILLRVLDAATNKLLVERALAVEVAAPREYVRLSSAAFLPSSLVKNRLSVSLAAIERLTGPPCFAELRLLPDRIPGLVAVTGGSLRGELPPPEKSLSLTAENLELLAGASEQGTAYVAVDGCPRAFVLQTTFARQGDPVTPRLDDRPAVRLRAPALALAGPNFTIGVEADNPPAGSTVEVTLGRQVGPAVQADFTRTLPAATEQRVSCSPFGKGGSLLVAAALADWSVSWDATGVAGERLLKARLLGSDGRELAAATQPITLDDQPADGVQFVSVTVPPQRDKPLTPLFAARDALSGVAKVQFFLGGALDGKPPAGVHVVEGKPLSVDDSLWGAELQAPPELKGEIAITAIVTNGVGLTKLATTNVTLPDAAAATVGRIQGVVSEGPRPQPGLEVTLKDEKGALKGKTKTDENGAFAFEALPPGKYAVDTAKPASNRRAEAVVKVEAMHASQAPLSLSLAN